MDHHWDVIGFCWILLWISSLLWGKLVVNWTTKRVDVHGLYQWWFLFAFWEFSMLDHLQVSLLWISLLLLLLLSSSSLSYLGAEHEKELETIASPLTLWNRLSLQDHRITTMICLSFWTTISFSLRLPSFPPLWMIHHYHISNEYTHALCQYDCFHSSTNQSINQSIIEKHHRCTYSCSSFILNDGTNDPCAFAVY